ncbi:MAG TPA: tRNA glutamyl-Q(34) synthetase GluQRS [Caulobacterales bacterium]|nr:tRNA glutamyl-Q(34) synthetase GluQRS [Caulobacterales bacterium]
MRVTRFAPSPTGFLHLGHAFSALFALDASGGGRFLLRIEDIDRARCKPEFEAAIFEDLGWLGLAWETPVRRQSEHMAHYQGALTRLIGRGVMYRCFRTRREVLEEIARAPHRGGEGPDGIVFRGEALGADEEQTRLARGESFAWRLSLDKARDALGAVFDELIFVETGGGPNGEHGEIAARPALLGDAVLARKDFPASYHLASVCDDGLQGVTLVTRGHDLFAATHLHVLLQALLDLPTPEYRHHRLILDAQGKRFAKRDHAATIRALRGLGKTPAEVRAMIALTH